jgi:hypothetical protein
MLPLIPHTLGDDRDYDFTVVDRAGVAEDITGWAFWFTVKASAADLDAAALFQLTSEDGGIVIDVAASGIGRVLIRAAHTKGEAAGKYRFDLQCRKGAAGAKIETLATGIFHLTEEITLAE